MTTEQSAERRVFEVRNGAVAHLGFSMDVPAGFVQVPVQGGAEGVDFDDPNQSAPLAVLADAATGAMIAVAGRPAYSEGGVLQWVRRLAEHFKMDLQHVQVQKVGAPPTHPGVTAFGAQKREGKKQSFMLTAFEDGGWLVTAHASCPADKWNEERLGNRISEAVESVVLTKKKGCRFKVDAPLPDKWSTPRKSKMQEEYERGLQERAERRAPAMGRVRELIERGRYDEVEGVVSGADRSIESDVAISRLFESRLREVVAAGGVKKDRRGTETLYTHALNWAQRCYPEPHTEVEAEDYERGRAEDHGRLVKVMGYDPDTGGTK